MCPGMEILKHYVPRVVFVCSCSGVRCRNEVQPYPCEGSMCAPVAGIHKFQKGYISVVRAICVGCTKNVPRGISS